MQIDISELSNTSLDPGRYEINPTTVEKIITPRLHQPGVVIDMRNVLFQGAGALHIEVARNLEIDNGQWKNINETAIVVRDDVKGLALRGQRIEKTGAHGIKISGGTASIHPQDLYLAYIDILEAGQSAESGDGVNLHTANNQGHVSRVMMEEVRVSKTGGEKESFGISAFAAKGIILLDCVGDGNCKFGHGVADVWVWGGRYDVLHFKYVAGLLNIGGNIAANVIEFVKQGGINAGGITRAIIEERLKGVSPFNKIQNGQGANISFASIPTATFPLPSWMSKPDVIEDDGPTEPVEPPTIPPADTPDEVSPTPVPLPVQSIDGLKLIHRWNCTEDYVPYGGKVKWRGLKPTLIKGNIPALQKTYPANRIGAPTQNSPADLTKVEFFINPLIPENTREFTLEWAFMIPQDTIELETNGGGHTYDVMKIASLCSYHSETFKKANDSFAAIVMLGDPVRNPDTQLLEYRPILYPYIESWEYKTGTNGDNFPVKQYASKNIPGDQIVTLYMTVKLNTLITDAEGNGSGLYDGELLLWRKLEGAIAPELIYERKGIKYSDTEIEIERYEYVTFRGGGDLRYGKDTDTVAYFLYYALHAGRPNGQVVDQPGTDPVDPDPVDVQTEVAKLKAALDAANAQILAQEATITLLKAEISSLNMSEQNKNRILEEVAMLAQSIKFKCTL